VAKLAIWFGVALIVLGVVGFALTGHVHPTALIPAWFGIALGVCGMLANTPDARRRMLWMHIAVTIALVGFIFPAVRAGMAIARFVGSNAAPTAAAKNAVHEELAMALICLVFTGMCVRSFIAARRTRTA
jgi:fucose 4-O-acetylase-like acetyltransferase